MSQWNAKKPKPKPDAPFEVYSPLATKSIIDTLTRKLFEQPLHPLPPVEAFWGAGVYALYYQGPFPTYQPLVGAVSKNNHRPVYVGKADPPGGLGGIADPDKRNQKLFDRLWEHARSIAEVDNLEVSDFRCRYLVIDHLFIGLAEHILIGSQRPVWNKFGLGGHSPGVGRKGQKKSAWDTVHPGREHTKARPPNDHDAAYWREQFARQIAGQQLESGGNDETENDENDEDSDE